MPQTAFSPIDPNALVGPYPQQSVVPQPSTPPSQVGGGSKAGAIAKIFTEFVGGAAQGRIRKFSMEQNERLKNIAILGQYVQSVESDPTKTDEYKAMVRQKYFSALGMEALKSFDEKGGKGKKGKGGAGDQQQQGPAGMIAGILKHVATGLVGGEMPKGAPDVNPHELIGQMEAEYQGNQNKYNISSVQQAVTAKVQAATQGVQDIEEFNRRIQGLLPEIYRAFGNQAQQVIQMWQSGYQAAPPAGSAEWYEREYARSHPPGSGAPPPQPPPSAGGATPIPNTPAAPPNVAALPNTGPVNPRDIVPDPNAPAQSPTGGAVPQRAFNEQEWRQIKGMKRASPAKRYEFGSTSNPTRFIGHWVEPPDSPAGYYYQNGTPVPVGPEKIREAPLSEPREERPEKNVTLTVGGNKIPGLQVAGVPPGERFQDLNGNKIDPSSITAINEREDPVARENEDLLLRSYAQDHNTTVDKLTDSQKVEALGIMTPKQKAREKLEDTFKADTTRAEAAWISRRDEAGKLAVVQGLPQDQIDQINKVIDTNYRAQSDWLDQMHENRKRLMDGSTPSPVAASTRRKVSVANNNPGNIMHKVGDSYELNQYATPQEGWDALRSELRTKITGQNAYGLKATSTLLDLAKVWAPEEAGNTPEDWARNVATYLKVPVGTPLGAYMTAERMEELAKAVWFAEGSGGTYTTATNQSSGNGNPPPSGPMKGSELMKLGR